MSTKRNPKNKKNEGRLQAKQITPLINIWMPSFVEEFFRT